MSEPAFITVAMVLADLKRQLDWRGSLGKPQGMIVITREHAQYLHDWSMRLIIAKDGLEAEVARLEREVTK